MGSSSNVPEIKVRMSADGVQDVINAFKRVQQEAQEIKPEGVGLMNQALEQMSELLPAIGIAVAVEGLVELGATALENADKIGKLSEKVGANVGTLSVLSLAARNTETDQDALGKGLVKLTKSMQDAADGSAKPKKAFADLGISMNDIKTNDPGQVFVLVAQKLQGIESPGIRAQATMNLFGKAGADLIPMMNSLADDGFAKLEEHAKNLGLYMTQDLVDGATKAKENLQELKDIALGLATQFEVGFAPMMAHAMEGFAGEVESNGVATMRDFGNIAGLVLNGIVNLARLVSQALGATFASILEGLLGVADTGGNVVNAVANGAGFKQIWALLKDGGANLAAGQSAIWSGFGKMAQQDYSDTFNPQIAPREKHKEGGGGGAGDSDNAAQQQKVAAARLQFLQSQADNELAINKARISSQQADNDADYAKGLETLTQYYDQKEVLINREIDAEIDALEKKMKAEQAYNPIDPAAQIKKQEAIAKDQAEIDALELKRGTELDKVASDRSTATAAAQSKYMENLKQLYTLEGDKAASEQVNLDLEIQKTDKLLKELGMSADARAVLLSTFRKNGESQIAFGTAQQAGSQGLTGMDQDISAVQNQASTGAISDLAAQGQILTIEQNRLAALQQIAAEQIIIAAQNTGPDHDKMMQSAIEYKQKIDAISASLYNTRTAFTYLTNEIFTTGRTALEQFFTDGISGAKSFSSAFADLGTAFEKILSDMIAKLITYYLMMELVGLVTQAFPGAANTLKGLTGSSPFGGGAGLSGGGTTGGGSGSGSFGTLGGYGSMAVGSVSPVSPMALATAGASPSENAGPLVQLQITNTSGQPTSTEQSHGANGQQLMDIFIGQAANDIRTGGKLGQQIQQTFSIGRKGVTRG